MGGGEVAQGYSSTAPLGSVPCQETASPLAVGPVDCGNSNGLQKLSNQWSLSLNLSPTCTWTSDRWRHNTICTWRSDHPKLLPHLHLEDNIWVLGPFTPGGTITRGSALPATEGAFNWATAPNHTNWRKRDLLKHRLHPNQLEEEIGRQQG